MSSRVIALAILVLASTVSSAEDVSVLSYRAVETLAPNPTWSTSKDQVRQLEDMYRNEGLTEDQVRQGLASHAREDQLIRNGRKNKYEIDVIVKDDQLGVRRVLPDGSDAIEEYLDQETYGFFHGSTDDVPIYSNGSIATVDYTANDAAKGPPVNWLPNTIGHRFAVCLLGFMSLRDVLKPMRLVSDDGATRLYQEGRYFWRVAPGPDGTPFSAVDWQVGSPTSYVGERLAVDGWTKVGGKLCAKGFHVSEWNKDGAKGDSRDFTLVYSSEQATADPKHLFAMVPSNTLVLDARPPKPASYRLHGRIPSVAEIAGDTLPEKAEKPGSPKASGPPPWPVFAVGGGLVAIVLGSTYMAVRAKKS